PGVTSSLKHFELVDGGWPRVSHALDGTRALLLEPERENLLDRGALACAPSVAISPDGCHDACTYNVGTGLTALVQSVVKPLPNPRGVFNFGPGSPFVYTVFLRMNALTVNDGAELSVKITGGTAG